MCVKGLFMQRNLQPWITTGIALVGASLIAVTPGTHAPAPEVQHRQFRLTDYDEFDLSSTGQARPKPTDPGWKPYSVPVIG